ncbi:hypothetical protein OROMI_018531 [Orobanche minor]
MVEKNGVKSRVVRCWGECNLLMSIAAILDPRLKMLVIEHCFPRICQPHEVEPNIEEVRVALYSLYGEYKKMYSGSSSVMSSSQSNASEQDRRATSVALSRSTVIYLMRIVFTQENAISIDIVNLDALKWWKESTKYKILSRMVADILAIPISTVASEATFSAGTRVIDTYRASLAPKTVDVHRRLVR